MNLYLANEKASERLRREPLWVRLCVSLVGAALGLGVVWIMISASMKAI